jgi:hypothetical protein
MKIESSAFTGADHMYLLFVKQTCVTRIALTQLFAIASSSAFASGMSELSVSTASPLSTLQESASVRRKLRRNRVIL